MNNAKKSVGGILTVELAKSILDTRIREEQQILCPVTFNFWHDDIIEMICRDLERLKSQEITRRIDDLDLDRLDYIDRLTELQHEHDRFKKFLADTREPLDVLNP